ETIAGGLRGLNAGGDEGAYVLAQVAIGEEEPIPVDVREVVGIDDAALGGRAAGLAVMELEFAAFGGGAGELFKDFVVGNWLRAGAERDALFPIGNVERNGVGQGRGHFFE